MRTPVAVLAAALLVAAVPALAQRPGQGPAPYRIVFDPARDVSQGREGPNNTLYVTVRFKIEGEKLTPEVAKQYKILVKENGNIRDRKDLPQVKPSEDLSLVLAMDISGSMNEPDRNKVRRIEQARAAANLFFNKLPAKADCGLILFNHTLKVKEPPSKDRGVLMDFVKKTEPSGGTAYLDATKGAVELWLSQIKAKGTAKAVVVMTDGMDFNSRAKLPEVIKTAKDFGVKVYTIGIGEPGKNDPVTTVLALDTSGSMKERADNNDTSTKIAALKGAAERFIDLMRVKATATLLPFSDQVRIPSPFSGDKEELKKILKESISKVKGETAFIDAAYTAVATLAAENPKGIKAVVVLTDGVDNSSRRRKEEVIARAREAGIKIYMLGLGRLEDKEKKQPAELDEATMRAIAEGTGGKYYHAGNQEKLMELFESLSFRLHDEGVNEEELKQLAFQTGGQYYPAKDANNLKFILEEVSQSVQKNETIKFASLFQADDGTVRNITLDLVRVVGGSGGGNEQPQYQVVETHEAQTQVRGVVVAEMNFLVYLSMLGVLGVLLSLPPALRRLTRGANGKS
jgi:Ca-activated chloride channel family protein